MLRLVCDCEPSGLFHVFHGRGQDSSLGDRPSMSFLGGCFCQKDPSSSESSYLKAV